MTSDEIWFGESGGGRGDGNKGPAVSEQHSSPGRDFQIFPNMIKYSNIIKYYQRSSSLWATLITCEGLSNIFKYDQVFKYTNIQILSKKRQSLGNTHHL